MTLEVNEKQLADFGMYLGAEGRFTLAEIKSFAIREGLSADGFTGLLKPLGNIVEDEAATYVEKAFQLMREKLCNLGDGIIAAAKSYGYTDDDNRSVFERTGEWRDRRDYERYLPESQRIPRH